MANIRETNLNLFFAFDALLQEGNVTRAAKRVGVTQSAMSSSLKQLRELFDDSLFVRTQHGISPTEKAIGLADPIRAGLAQFERALEPAQFDPKNAKRTFVLQASDYMEFVMLPPLLRRLEELAPGIRLQVHAWGRHEPSPELKAGGVDIMLGYTRLLPAHFRETILFDERYVCLVRKGHPKVNRRLSLRAYLEMSHVVVSEGDRLGTASVDRALEKHGKSRCIGARVSHFLMVPRLIASTDMVAALSERVASAFLPAFPVRLFPPPLALPNGKPSLVWHERSEADKGHAWMRELIAEVAQRV